jgi:formate dehydrogenase formation protein
MPASSGRDRLSGPADLAALRRAVAEQIAPLREVAADVALAVGDVVDGAAARERVQSRLTAYDASRVIGAVGSLLVPFVRATIALERAGLATETEAADARDRRFQLAPLIGDWMNAEPMPRDPAKATARRAAAVVLGAVLKRASAGALAGVSLDGWNRAHCPGCGGPPDFAERGEAGGRMLACSRCDTRWKAVAPGCLGCGATEAPEVARIASGTLGYTLVICNACGRYIKEPTGTLGDDLLAERVLTAQLDGAAEARGLRL